MNYTANYKLPQWVESDRILMTDFNDAMEKLDAGLHSKASSETVSALAEDVSEQLTSLATGLGSKGKNCRIAWGSYTGTGTVGSSGPNRLTFPFQPKLVWVVYGHHSDGSSPQFASMLLCYPVGAAYGGEAMMDVSWGDKSVEWYLYYTSSSRSDEQQYNRSGWTYHWVAVGADE